MDQLQDVREQLKANAEQAKTDREQLTCERGKSIGVEVLITGPEEDGVAAVVDQGILSAMTIPWEASHIRAE